MPLAETPFATKSRRMHALSLDNWETAWQQDAADLWANTLTAHIQGHIPVVGVTS